MNNTPVPQNLPEELLPLYDWWKSKGPKTLVQLALAAFVAIALYAFWQWRQARLDQASAQITAAQSVDELEAAEARYGSTGAGSLLQLRLARAYYDLSRYDDALATYNAFLTRNANHPFAPVARLGIAATQEAMGDYPAAQESYTQLVEPDYPVPQVAYTQLDEPATPAYLLPEAKLGIVRVLFLSGKKDEAAAQLEAFLADPANKEWETFARNLKETLRTYKPRVRPSLMNLADAIAPVAAKDAPAVPENKPSDEAKAAPKPVAPAPAKASETKPAPAATDAPKAAAAKPATDAKATPKAPEAKPAPGPAAKPAADAKATPKAPEAKPAPVPAAKPTDAAKGASK